MALQPLTVDPIASASVAADVTRTRSLPTDIVGVANLTSTLAGTPLPKVHRASAENILELLDSIDDSDFSPLQIHFLWQRWIKASINKHFEDNKGPLPLYFEGDERTLQDDAEFYELRVTGPMLLQYQKGEFFADVQINVLVQAHPDDRDLYTIDNAIGYAARAFTNAICVYKFGNDHEFDEPTELLGALKLQRDVDEEVAVNQFGIIKEDTRLTQATIEGHYRMEL